MHTEFDARPRFERLLSRSAIALVICLALVVSLVGTPTQAIDVEVSTDPQRGMAELPEHLIGEDFLAVDDEERAGQPIHVVPLNPARLLDTRAGDGASTVDGRFLGSGRVEPDKTLSLEVTGRGGVPSEGAGAVMLNVTVVDPSSNGYLTVFPCGEDRPDASNLNFTSGEVVPNAALAKIGQGGRVCIYSKSATDLVVDVNGWIARGAAVRAVQPARLLDTRRSADASTVDGAGLGRGLAAAGSVIRVPVLGRGAVPDKNVDAALLNVTAVSPSRDGYLTVFPCGEKTPETSSVNYRRGEIAPNAVYAKAGLDGEICVFTSARSHVVVDVNGWSTKSAGAVAVSPARLLDTRSADVGRTIDGLFAGVGRRPAGTVLELDVASRGGVPRSGVGSVMLNVTAVAPDSDGYLTVFPCGEERPTASSVNYRASDVAPNAVLAKVGDGGKVCIFTLSTTDVVVDVNSYFQTAPNQPDSTVTVVDDAEVAEGGSGTGGAVLTRDQSRSDLELGDLVVSHDNGSNVYYGRVIDVTADEVVTEEVALGEIFPVLDLSVTVDTSDGGVVADVGGDTVRNVMIDGQPAGSPLRPEEGRLPQGTASCSSGASASIEAEVDSNPGNFVFDVSFNRWKTSLDHARIGYNPYIEASVTAQASGKVSCSMSKQLANWELPSISFSIGPVPVWITQDLNLKLNGSVSAEVSASRTWNARAEAWFGLEYSNGSWDRQASMNFTADDISTSKVGLDAEAALPFRYEAKLYGVAGLNATLEPKLDLTYRPLEDQDLTLTGRLNGAIGAVVELDLKVKKFRWDTNFVETTLWGPNELWTRTSTSPPSPTTTTTTQPTTPTTTAPPGESYIGKIIRGPGGDSHYVNNEGKREWVPDSPTYDCEVGRGTQVVDVSDSVIHSIPEVGWHYCLNKANLRGKILSHSDGDSSYIHPDDTRTWIPDKPTFDCRRRQGKEQVETRWREYVDAFTDTGWDWCFDINTMKNKLIAHPDGDVHFVDERGVRHWIPNTSTYDCLSGWGYPTVDVLWREYITNIPEGEWAVCGSTLRDGVKLDRGQRLQSSDGRYTLKMQAGDGNLVLYNSRRQPIWATNRLGGAYVILHGDGHLIVHKSNGDQIWRSETGGSNADRLVMQSDGNLVLYRGSTAVWSTNTAGR